MNQSAPTLSTGTYRLLAAGFVIFVIYGSLVPLHYEPVPLAEAVAAFREVCAQPVRVTSLSDWVTNVVLFVPLAFLLMGATCVDRPRSWGPRVGLLVLPFCTLLSASIEFTQLSFPPRVSSLDDVVAESIGGMIGITVWLAVGQLGTEWVRQTWDALADDGWGARLLPLYLVFLIVIETMPLDLTLRPSELYRKYRLGHIHLVPFMFGDETWLQLLTKQLWNVLYFLPVGLLLPQLRGCDWHTFRAWRRVLLTGLATAGFVEAVQFFVESRNCEGTDVISGTLAIVGGWAACLAWRQRRARTGDSDLQWGVLGVWLLLLAFLDWQPFDFEFDTDWLEARWRNLSLVPFADYQQATTLHALDQLLRRVVLWAPLGALLALVFVTSDARVPLLLAAVFALTLEVGQLFLPERYPSVTDVLLETAGAGAGIYLVRRVAAAARRPHDAYC